MKAIFSVGLNVGQAELPRQLTLTLYHLVSRVTVRDLYVGGSQWQGIPERFVQVAALVPPDVSPDTVARELAVELRQSCVAVLNRAGNCWRLIDRDGQVEQGAPVAEFPVYVTWS